MKLKSYPFVYPRRGVADASPRADSNEQLAQESIPMSDVRSQTFTAADGFAFAAGRTATSIGSS